MVKVDGIVRERGSDYYLEVGGPETTIKRYKILRAEYAIPDSPENYFINAQAKLYEAANHAASGELADDVSQPADQFYDGWIRHGTLDVRHNFREI